MLSVIIPVVVLFLVILVPIKAIRNVNIRLGLLLSALIAMVMGDMGPAESVRAAIGGIDKLSWVIGLSLFGSIYAQTQVRMGAIDTVLNTLRASIGKTSKGLIASIIITLVIAGSLLGDAIASVTVIGILVIKALDDMNLSPEQTGCILLLGAVCGSIMPPITQGFFLSASLVNTPVDPVIKVGYVTVGVLVVASILWCWTFVRSNRLPEELIPARPATRILADEWTRLIPLITLIVIIILRSGFKIEVLKVLDPLLSPLGQIPVVRAVTAFGGSSRILQAIAVATLVAFCAPTVRGKILDVFRKGLVSVSKTVQIQICAGVMIGAFYEAGLIDKVLLFTKTLSAAMLKVGGGAMLMLVGMLTGSQSTAQNTIFAFLGPILTGNLDVSPRAAALGGAHLAMAGQSMPPACLTTFVIVGIVGGVLAKKADPIRIMFLAFPITILSALIGYAAWFGLF